MKTFKLIVLIGVSLFHFSCSDDLLDLDPISEMNENEFYETEEDFQLAVNAAYETLHIHYGPEGGLSYTEQLSDEATMFRVAGSISDRQAFKDYNLRPDNTVVQAIWDDSFIALNRINTVLTRLESVDLDENVESVFTAEMRFLRGLYYFNLVRMFGPLPLLDRTVSVQESYQILRSPENEVYDLVISDLEYAAANLPLRSETEIEGQATKGAAKGILGKVYLALGDNNAAQDILMEVISSGEYELIDNYENLWDIENENTEEGVFEIQYLGGVGNPYSDYWTAFAPFENFSITRAAGGMNMVTEDLWEAYEEGDPRREASINEGYYDTSGTWIPILFPKKWEDRTVIDRYGSEFSENNFIVLRYADILLMYAEAANDPEYLNMVRRRVGLPEYGTPGYPSEEYPTLKLAIAHERHVELALEFHRWFDLKRLDLAIPVISEAKDVTITEEDLLLPIPQSVRDQNPEIAQNPGY
ncbi:RagB/SusD family nutrient uptake outer membrane protein [Autumnicola psychrophila]|uniref:RagB/SusD family nutrient uptake outer membrane protein n=1 Tax=Autumnicola psychrophila TaxID=3075592 RepID=A0ABU3DU38_9FLAO|nr:RagB/SusD family nutrient uptake outer membrane protein [Zunongwangia sp. F225]MDT0687219.1 RagB/SusD family nutrient uptake outer membrane protein [Zunongwangia sp. F225]